MPGVKPVATVAPRGVDGVSLLDSGRAWIAVGAAFMAMFTVFGVAYSFGAFFTSMSAEFNAGSGATSAVFSITAFLYFTLGLVSGSVADRVGPRWVLATGAVAMGAGLALTSLVHALWVGYITYGMGVGIGVGCGYVPMVAVVGAWFERRRSMAVGVAVSGIGLGTLGVAPLAAILIDRSGWRATYLVFAAGSFLILAVCAAVIERPPPGPPAPRGHLRATVRTRPFRLLYISLVLMSLPLSVALVYLPPFGRSLGASPVAAAGLVGILGGASVLGRLTLGAVADRVGRLRTFQLATGTMALSYAIWLMAGGYLALVAYAVVMGVGYGGYIALSPAVLADLFGLGGLGGTVGAMYTAAGVGALAGPPLAGQIIDVTGGYRWAVGAALVIALASAASILPLHRGERAR